MPTHVQLMLRGIHAEGDNRVIADPQFLAEVSGVEAREACMWRVGIKNAAPAGSGWPPGHHEPAQLVPWTVRSPFVCVTQCDCCAVSWRMDGRAALLGGVHDWALLPLQQLTCRFACAALRRLVALSSDLQAFSMHTCDGMSCLSYLLPISQQSHTCML
eukprot:355645-Chlamydomonas_euryale.AAC.1